MTSFSSSFWCCAVAAPAIALNRTRARREMRVPSGMKAFMKSDTQVRLAWFPSQATSRGQGWVFRRRVAGTQGFEPRYADPESAVLPLDDVPIATSILPKLAHGIHIC